jgi:ubiquitin-like protein Pup
MKQEHVKKQRTRVTKNTRTEVIDGEKGSRSEIRRKAIQAEMDEMLADIDEVLEENAEEFVGAFVQKGGE